ncbi:MAG: hypothetical protein OEZ38_13150, partial [Gammaproteobacteria bacterium]|nr:hypothetical protein [Gammaproteobacteria bacterium]
MSVRNSFTLLLLLLVSNQLLADYKADIGHTRLLNELGASTPNGAGVQVAQSEADTDGVAGSPFAALPDASDSRFTGKTIINVTPGNNTVSGHATGVGALFYGNTGIAGGITLIDAH